MFRSPRFTATTDGLVTPRCRPLVACCHPFGIAIEWLDGWLDLIPRYSRRYGWSRYGDWGCYPLRMHRFWSPLQFAGDE
ncbi:MAG: hypothetical protein ACRDMV_01105 [Streptosporangiales bacterium]